MNRNPGGPGVFLSTSKVPALNLALEEYLLSTIEDGGEQLFLYENLPAVVIGRFQNPWNECRTGLARRLDIPIRRRVSGGGTVVHGPGNLNLSVITAKPLPDKDGNLHRVIRAMARIGTEVEINNRHDLLVRIPSGPDGESFKVSGSAFRQIPRRSMHHATLLVDADLKHLKQLLRLPERDLDVRGVISKPSPVANLSDVSPGITVSDVIETLCSEWDGLSPPVSVDPGEYKGEPIFNEALGRQISDSWIWGKTASFRERFHGFPDLQGDTLELEIRKGIVSAVSLNGPRGPVTEPGTEFLIGIPYHGPSILEAAGSAPPVWVDRLSRVVDGDTPGP